MNRRSFIKNAGIAAAGAPFAINGMPVRVWRDQEMLQAIAAASESDRVLVLVQLHGGNDGLNTTIPLNEYAAYYSARPNLALPQNGNRKIIQLDSSMPSHKNLGVHPDMTAAKAMYEQDRMAVIQSISYPYMNGSHFRSRDVWFMGGGHADYYSSGWMGRYLDQVFPNYPDDYPSASMPDPLAIEMGTGVSLAFHRDNGIPLGLSIANPLSFYNLINSVGVAPPISFPDTYAGDELEYIMQIERESNTYAARLRDVYLAGANSTVDYPQQYPYLAPQGALNNPLSAQLKIIARLLDGGCKTKIFLCRIGGFDTHAMQVDPNDTTMGLHSALLYHVFSAVKAFHDDLQALGMGDRVLTLTTSEFGRRIYSNGSFGSDHGNAAPLFAFGECVKSGIYGDNVALSSLTGGSVPMGIDYRQVMCTIVADWFGASQQVLEAVRFDTWMNTKIDYLSCATAGLSAEQREQAAFIYPNPSVGPAKFVHPVMESGNFTLTLSDISGRILLTRKQYAEPPELHWDLPWQGLPAGTYLVSVWGRHISLSRKWLVSSD
jgi:uncharacterized protein (DUF1501 family)